MIKLTLAFAGLMMTAFASWKGQTLDSSEIKRRWGEKKFVATTFKEASIDERATMVADLIKNQQQYRGKTALEIRASLGTFSGHYFNESYPTYLIQKWTEGKPETWQLVFLIDRHSKVKDIVVHKNCCY